jgi:hypothetical protein
MSEYLIRVYGKTTLTLERTELSFVPWASDDFPVAIVEIRGDKVPIDGGSFADTHAGGHVTMRELRNVAESPVTYPIVVTAFEHDDTNASSFTMEKSRLFVSAGAVVHTFQVSPTFEINDPGLDSSVTLDRVWFEPPPEDDSAVGKNVDSDDLAGEFAFVESAGTLRVTSSRFTQLTLRNKPLMVAPRILLDQLMVDGIACPDCAETSNDTVLAEGRNLFVQSSLICGLTGGGAAFGAFTDDARVHVVNSAVWQLGQSLIRLNPSEAAGAEMFIANVTLEHPSSEPLAVVGPMDSTNVTIQNSYLQGNWSLDNGVGTVEGTVMSQAITNAPCGDFEGEGCTVTETDHLDFVYASGVCGDAMGDIAGLLLSEPESWPEKYLSDLTADAPTDRPALIRIAGGERVEGWSLPSEGDFWETAHNWCLANDGTGDVEIGAWSSAPEDVKIGAEFAGPEDSHSTEKLCSLALLKPYDAPAGDSEDTGQASDSGGLPGADQTESNAPDGLADASAYGLAAGCRYSAAGVFLLLPLGLRRRRRSRSGA